MDAATTLYGGAFVLSPWFARGGDFATVTAEAVRISGTAYVEIKLFHKNRGEAGSGANADSARLITLSSVGRTTLDWAKSGTMLGFKQLVRYQFKAAGGASDAVRFRVYSPVWYDDVAT